MRVSGQPYRSIWADAANGTVFIVDQTLLPYQFAVRALRTVDEAAEAIKSMRVRGAPLIGATAYYGVALALREDASDAALEQSCALLSQTRPTAVNLRHALERAVASLRLLAPAARMDAAWRAAGAYAEDDVATNLAIGQNGLGVLRSLHAKIDRRLNVMTHCNAGWLATVDYGTALAPVYLAYDAGVPVHVWVSETRPRNQGLLTAWELREHGVAHTLIADNAAGYLMAQGRTDVILVGADRVTRHGDICNKIGTYMKALSAWRHHIPFYAAVPGSTVDWEVESADLIPIEERSAREVRRVVGSDAQGRPTEIALADDATAVCNPAFDVTPAVLVTGLITERGICAADEEALRRMYAPEQGRGK